MPRSRPQCQTGRPAPGQARGRHGARGAPAGRHFGQSAGAANPSRESGAGDAPGGDGQEAHWRAKGDPFRMDRPRRGIPRTLGVPEAGASRRPGGAGGNRSPRQRPARGARPATRRGGRAADAGQAAEFRPHRPAARTILGGRLRGRHGSRCVRAAAGHVARFPALRRADGSPLAGLGALRGHGRLSRRHGRERVSVPRLHRALVQREQAIRRDDAGAACG